MGCWLARDCTMCGRPDAALLIWENQVHHAWCFCADGPCGPSCAIVLSVPYQTTSTMPLPPAAIHGIRLVLAGAELMRLGALHRPQSVPALLGRAQEYQTW